MTVEISKIKQAKFYIEADLESPAGILGVY